MEDYIVGASISDAVEKADEFKKNDPFNKSWDELKGLVNLDQNFKRRTARNLNKVDITQNYLNSANSSPTGIDNTKSKAINPGAVIRNGYGLFDVITPPYNLYELANYYDTSFA
ncbi:MAG: hypothetical protein EBS98_10940, partial [Chitinophagia bacterium]|nr:hypothetical protein [Chitinophagia bacterium]